MQSSSPLVLRNISWSWCWWHCIPIGLFYLTWKAREYGLHTRFIELAGEINGAMPEYVVQRLSEALNKRKMPLSGSKILILGIAYKKNVDDMRESNSLELISRLIGSGAKVSYSDPYIPELTKTRKFDINLKSVDLCVDNIVDFDALIYALMRI